MKRLFLHGYGTEKGQLTKFLNLKIFSWAVPYVHQNAAELVSNLVQLVGAGILSKETGSEESGYGKTMNGIVSCVNIRNSNKLTCYIN